MGMRKRSTTSRMRVQLVATPLCAVSRVGVSAMASSKAVKAQLKAAKAAVGKKDYQEVSRICQVSSTPCLIHSPPSELQFMTDQLIATLLVIANIIHTWCYKLVFP